MKTNPRTIRATAAATVATLLLAGTAAATTATTEPPTDSTSADSADSAEATLLPPAEGNVTYPLTITSALGEIVIEQRPERIVVPDSFDADILAAIGVTPVGADEQIHFYPWATERIQIDSVVTWPVGDVDFPPELIATTDPDLIFAGWFDDIDNLDQISAIAPVLGAPVVADGEPTWRDRLTLVAEALDLSDAAQAYLDEHDAYFAGVREEHPEFAGKSIAYLVFWGGEWGTGFLNATGMNGELVLTELGFAPSVQADNYASGDAVSDELIGQLTDDVILVVDQSGGGEELEAFLAAPLLQGTPAASNDLLIVLITDWETDDMLYEGEPQGFSGHFGRALNVGPLGQREVAELLVPIFAERLG